jgi:hypothetical protein
LNPDFLQVKSLEGELKISHKKKDYGVTISTKELVFHKPHVNYYIKLEDIITMSPFEWKGPNRAAAGRNRQQQAEYAGTSPGADHYRLYVKAATKHSRSGISRLGTMQFVLPIHRKLVQAIADFSGMTIIS